ncbi:hypothetical protein JRO89_XS12G0230700 [Xanthoceras sorbifolium]|uniref:RING-type domain-containing protein n=1 Tax=Xanthoceras sorbifolium TaxID=99658 RepID=A0ABQ8HDH7_9ROSI|nr:hypothetical protein JRO89_XS12G0230700 [Xanthoceras sorbifolium]
MCLLNDFAIFISKMDSSSSYQFQLSQNNAILDRMSNSSSSSDWNQHSSGFVIELRVEHRFQHPVSQWTGTVDSYQRLLYKREAEFRFQSGIQRFLKDILTAEQVAVDSEGRFPDGNGVRLRLPNLISSSGSLYSYTVNSLANMANFVFEGVWMTRNDPRNSSMRLVPIQMHLEIVSNQEFRSLDDSIILDSESESSEEGDSINSDAEQHPLIWVVEPLRIYGGVGGLRLAIQALKEVQVEAASSEECCSICLERVGVGQTASQTPCSHMFHRECILQWLQRDTSCPLCRAQIR